MNVLSLQDKVSDLLCSLWRGVDQKPFTREDISVFALIVLLTNETMCQLRDLELFPFLRFQSNFFNRYAKFHQILRKAT